MTAGTSAVTDSEEPIAPELIERAILEVARGMKALNKTRLKREAIVALIKDKSGLNKSTIEIVLNNLDRLEEIWLKKKETSK